MRFVADQRGVEQTLVCSLRRRLEFPVGTANEQTEVCSTLDSHFYYRLMSAGDVPCDFCCKKLFLLLVVENFGVRAIETPSSRERVRARAGKTAEILTAYLSDI